MTAKEIEQQITFNEHEDEDTQSISVVATIAFHARGIYTKRAIKLSQGNVQVAIRRDLTERLMRRIYDDQRDLFYKAIMDLRSVNPMDYEKMRDAHNALLEAAKRQPPTK